MKIFFAVILLYTCSAVNAQDYNVLLIPDSLAKNANAVKRFEELHVVIKSVNKAIIKHKYVITILNEKGDKYAQYYNDYDNLHDLSDISGDLYDAFGKRIKGVKKKDIADVSLQDGITLMGDARIKAHNFYYRQYPYTVEYEDQQEYDGFFILPNWQPFDDENYSVQQSKFIVETPANYQLRYKQFNYTGAPIITSKSDATIYTWEIKNAPAIIPEILSPSFEEIATTVFIAPTDFSLKGYTGNMSTWLNFGKFHADLNKGRDELPENIKAEVHKLVDGLNDPKEKIKVLYQYLQNNTRYISIQLGIGGWQPFDAKYVAAKRYGDCKALSNYMHALLKEAGIQGYYTIIKAGRDNKFYMPDFPSKQSNHVIIAVPLNKDTMWLECTDQYTAAGYLGSFTGNRYALMIKDDGGYLIKTPHYTENDNLQVRKLSSSLDDKGNLTLKVETNYTGLEQDQLFFSINYLSKDKLLERLKNDIDLPTYDITGFNYVQHKKIVPSIDEQLNIVSDNYATISGKRLFILPNILTRNEVKLSSSDVRKYDIVYDYSFTHIDTATITIPAGYTIEAMPKDVTISNKFGNYEVHFKVEGEKIFFTRLYKRSEGRFPPSDYAELVKFYDDMYKADRSKIVFVKKEE